MNLVIIYRKNTKTRYVLLQNLKSEQRMVMGTILNQNEYMIMDMETAGPYLSMAPDQSWMGLRYIYTPMEYNPKSLILQPKSGEGMDALARDLEEERIELNLQPRWRYAVDRRA